MKITKKNFFVVMMIVFTFIFLAAVLLVIFPIFQKTVRNSLAFSEAKKTLFLFERSSAEMDLLTEDFQRLKGDLEKINALFINKEFPIDLIKFWEKTAEEFSLKINISSPSFPSEQTEEWPLINFTINLVGSFNDFLKFLKKIENSPYLIEITNINIRRQTGKTSDLFSEENISAALFLKVYTK